MLSRTCTRRAEWDHRWAPAHNWRSLILSPLFREEATKYAFVIHSKKKYYRSEAPGSVSYNYFPPCASGQCYECLIFHPTVADVFLEVIQTLDKTKRDPELNNNEVQFRIIKKLPYVFGLLGHPCVIGDYGAVWSCIMDKLDQLFPYECLLMVDISRDIESYKFLYISESESDGDIDIDELEDFYFGIQPDGFHESFL